MRRCQTRVAAVFLACAAGAVAVTGADELRQPLAAISPAEAEAAAREAAARLEATPGPALAEALDALVESLQAGGHAAEPETCRLAERAVARRRVDGSSPSELAASLARLGEVLTAARELDGAASALTEAEALVRATAGDGREHALVLNRLAAVRRARGELAESIRLYRDALAELELDGAKGDPELATCLTGMGGAVYESRDFQSARRIYQDLVDEQISTTGEGSAEVGMALRYLASTFSAMGDLETGERLLRQSLSILEAQLGPSDLEVAYVVNSIAIDVRKRGDYLEARRMLERALAILELRLGPEHRYVAGVLNNLGNTYAAMRDLPAARQAYERALTIREHSAVPAPLEVAQSLSNLGALVLDEGDVERAVALLERALAIREESLGSNARPVGLTLVNLGDALLEAGSLQRAREALERAAAILEQQPDGVHSSLAFARINLGLVQLQQGSLDEAASTFDRARAQLEATRGHGHPRVGELMYCQAKVAAYRGNLDSALGLALESVRVDAEHLRLTAAGLSQRQAILYATEQQQALDLALTIAVEGPIEDPTLVAATWDALIRSRGAVLEEMATRRRRLLESKGDSSSLVEALRVAAYRLSLLLVEGEDSASVAELRAAREELDRAERALGEASPPFLRDQARAALGLEEVSSSLPPGSGLVAYARFDRQFTLDPARRRGPSEPWYLALVRSPTGRLDVVPLADGAAVDGWVREWRSAAGRPTGSKLAAHAAGDRLRELIWDPVAERVAGAETIFVVPDGELGLLNFAALPTGSESFLIESGPLLAMVGQERDIVPDEIETSRSACLLAIGAPDFDAAPNGRSAAATDTAGLGPGSSRSSRDGLTHSRFPPLPGTAAETAAVAELWRRADLHEAALRLTGDEATEAAFKALAPGFRVLHLATHGFFFDGSASPPAESGRGVGAIVPAGATAIPSDSFDQLKLSGLALAGANHQGGDFGEDCILTAEEIAVLDLSGVEWAVLSACESGVGEASSREGVFGLRRAFRVAGARTVIMSLWSVDDDAAREWMVALYRARLEDGLSTAEAVRRAGLDVLAARRLRGLSVHPASWAAFVATGDWR